MIVSKTKRKPQDKINAKLTEDGNLFEMVKRIKYQKVNAGKERRGEERTG